MFFARKFSKFIAFIFRVFGNTAFYSVYSENKKREIFIYLNMRKNSFILSRWKDRIPSTRFCFKKRLGGGNGELKAAMQYMSQSFRVKDSAIKYLFFDIAAEELGHMEIVVQTINFLNGHDVDAASVPAGEIQSHVILGFNPGLISS